MKNALLAQLLCRGGIEPVAHPARNAPATQSVFKAASVARQMFGGDVDIVRVLAMQATIETGRYVPDADEVADRVLATIAHSRRH